MEKSSNQKGTKEELNKIEAKWGKGEIYTDKYNLKILKD